MVRGEFSFLGVVPMDGYFLKFYLNSGGIAILDMKPYLDKGDFIVLRDWNIFKTVRLDDLEGVEWSYANLSLSKDTILANMY